MILTSHTLDMWISLQIHEYEYLDLWYMEKLSDLQFFFLAYSGLGYISLSLIIKSADFSFLFLFGCLLNFGRCHTQEDQG